VSDSILTGPVQATILYYLHFHKAQWLLCVYQPEYNSELSIFSTPYFWVSHDSHNKHVPSTMWY